MKKQLTLLFIITGLMSLCAQTLQWATPMLGPGGGTGRKIAVDGSGNVYAIGQFSNTVDFDPGPGTFTLASGGAFDAFVSKQDASGNLIWANRFGGVGNDDGLTIAVDALGDVYTYQNLSSGGNRFVKLLSTNGNTVWTKPTGGTVNSITIDGSGNIFLAGGFGGTQDFDPSAASFTLASAGSNDGFITKLDAAGNFVWAKRFGGTGSEIITSVSVDNSGNVFTTGQFNQTADFDPGPATYTLSAVGSGDIFVHKLTSAGNFAWAVRAGGNLNEAGYGIVTDASGNCYATGNFAATIPVDFDPGPGTFTLSGTNNGFVWKLDPSGSLIFAKNIGGPAISIARDAVGNIYTSGSIPPVPYDFDPGPGTYTLSSSGASDPYISKLDASGNFVFAGLIGGANIDVAYSMTADAGGNVYMTGYFNGTADFDPTAGVTTYTAPGTSLGYVYTMKLNMMLTGLNSIEETVNTFKLFPNPSNGNFNLLFEKEVKEATISITDIMGKEVLKKDMNGGQELELSIETRGLYFVKIESENTYEIKKLIIQ